MFDTTAYLARQSTYLRRNLFSPPEIIADVMNRYAPQITAEDIEAWRQRYYQTADASDRKGLAVYPDEADYILTALSDRLQDGATKREAARWLGRRLRRGDMTYSRAEHLALNTGDKRRKWDAAADDEVLSTPHSQRSDHEINHVYLLARELSTTASDDLTHNDKAPVTDEEPHDTDPESDSLPGPIVTMGLGAGVTAVLDADCQQASLMLGHAGASYSKCQLATVVDRLTVLLGLMTQEDC